MSQALKYDGSQPTAINDQTYADDVVLLALSASAMRMMLALCDEFATEFSVVFNANKSKCLVMQPRQHRFSPTLKLDFHVGGRVIEVVEQWPHLGPVIF